ncbi:MAG: KaiC domain-containing protein [Methanofollis liminatans]|jgi:KaiC domain protein|uniref:Putative circadian clock protein, KaiC n=1 Tax=Methanofollis liminatans DSM 4140 TaxID=28892 RepID=J0SBA2_9EURY|nr:KaiC domain-containing protein [Methanofollis liminatans]EJG07999.1 putative circadian clock protein, KaiC [Methanofollis liminatans DSM 4140]MDD3111438.1 KaiC domain-containing protein [Methanofollis liminatans]
MNGDDEQRVQFGIEGLDSMLSGGIFEGSICSIVGTYGTGKTTFALQFIYEGLKQGEKAIFISLDERTEMIHRDILRRGWDLDTYLDKSLFVIKLDPTDFTVAVNQIKDELPQLIRSVGARRVVIDPISLFEGIFTDESTRRQELFRFIERMRDEDCTLILTSETLQNNPYASKYSLIEYMVDTVILLRYIRPSDLSEVHPAVEVVKMRGSNHSREIKPYEILKDRVQVYSEANVF